MELQTVSTYSELVSRVVEAGWSAEELSFLAWSHRQARRARVDLMAIDIDGERLVSRGEAEVMYAALPHDAVVVATLRSECLVTTPSVPKVLSAA